MLDAKFWYNAYMKYVAFTLVVFFAHEVFAAESITSIREYTSRVRARIVHKIQDALGGDRRVEIRGVVTYSAEDRFFLQNGSAGLKILSDDSLSSKNSQPVVGDEISVVGSPSLEGGRVIFIAHKWKRLGQGSVPLAREAFAPNLIEGDINNELNWLRVTVEGRVMGKTETGFAINVDGVPVTVLTSKAPDFIEDSEHLNPKVAVTGVVELMLDQSSLLGSDGYVLGVKINVNETSDIVLKSDLSYLAARHNRVFTAIMIAALMILGGGLLTFLFVIFRQQRRLFRSRTIMAERKRMADDIHDTIEQHLVGAGMLLKVNRTKEAQDVLVRAKREIRDIVWGLKNDDMMRLTPAEMLRKLAHEENTKGLYRVDTRFEGLPEVLDAASMRDLSLVVREAIGNAVKHGGAKKIAISSDPLPNGGWKMRISNDGASFDPNQAPGIKEGHFGIEGMRQRARRLGATLSFEPRGKGMVLILEKNMV